MRITTIYFFSQWWSEDFTHHQTRQKSTFHGFMDINWTHWETRNITNYFECQSNGQRSTQTLWNIDIPSLAALLNKSWRLMCLSMLSIFQALRTRRRLMREMCAHLTKYKMTFCALFGRLYISWRNPEGKSASKPTWKMWCLRNSQLTIVTKEQVTRQQEVEHICYSSSVSMYITIKI